MGTQIELALVAIERWERLSVQEQLRFKELAARGAPNPRASLDQREYKELRRMWKRLQPGDFLRTAVRILAGRDGGAGKRRA